MEQRGYACMLGEIKRTSIRIGNRELRASDLVFAAVFIAAAIFTLACVPRGLTVTDEVQYQFVCLRLLAGDKLLAGNWQVVSMQTVFQYLPFRIFYALRGGFDGLVLAMRYVYAGIKLIFCAYVYLRLRKYGLWAVYAAVFFGGTDLFGIKTMSYYSICAQTVLLVGMLLFINENQKPIRWILAGFFFSCCVLAFPPAAAVWLLYGILVAVRLLAAKRGRAVWDAYGFVLSGRSWLYMLLGIGASAVLFFILCAVFFTGTDLPAIFDGIKRVVGFVNSGSTAGPDFFSVRLSKLTRYVGFMHPVLLILTAFVFAGGILLRRFTKKAERPCFLLLCLLCAAITVRLLLLSDAEVGDASGECSCHPLFLAVPALAAYVFTENKDRRVFSFLIFCCAVSFVVDMYSMNSVGALLLPGCVPSVLLLREYWLEQLMGTAAEKKKRGKSRTKKRNGLGTGKAWVAALCALCVLFPSLELWHWAYMAGLHETERMFFGSEAPLDAVLDTGVLQGIVTTRELKINYDKSVRDAEICRSLCENAFLAVDYDTSVYINADLPVSVPLLHYLTDNWAQEEYWWSLHPEKRPDVVYIPFFTLSYIPYERFTPQDYIAYFEKNADISVIKGEIGYIVVINDWFQN
ncbi:MAG: hypothetical protein IJL25_08910 [Clostridia bacterium]|nr:hypothetical protein [Clostridia bacterium]